MTAEDINDPFEIDPSVADMGDPTVIGNIVRLPFITQNFWWNNGNIEAESGVRRFGGWAMNEADYLEWTSQYDDLPTGLAGPLDWAGRLSKDSYTVYAVRHLWVIPAVRRSAWFLKKDGNPDNKGDWKSSTEWLCYSAQVSVKERKVIPLGPMVLKAKSNSGLSLDAAFQEYKTKTAEPRKTLAKNMPAHLFYRPVGTFGEKPHFKTVGSTVKNDITPVENYYPAEWTADYMRLTFASRDIQAIIADMLTQSKEWADDWNLRGKKAKEERAAAQNMIETAQGLGGVYLGAPDDSQIPF